ncbi:transposase [Bradyrhizobium sp. GM7.3]
MRSPAPEENRIIYLAGGAIACLARRGRLGIPRAIFYHWYWRYREGGSDMLADHRSQPEQVSAKSRTGCQTPLFRMDPEDGLIWSSVSVTTTSWRSLNRPGFAGGSNS